MPAQSGTNAITQFSNPLTFSSEIYDSTLGLQYYNYRHLNLLDGRWVNRDPIEEDGGVNLYGMVGNSPMLWIDFGGLSGEIYTKVDYLYDIIETTAWHCRCEQCSDKSVCDDTKCAWEVLTKTKRRQLYRMTVAKKRLIIGNCQDLMEVLSGVFGKSAIEAIGCANFSLLKYLYGLIAAKEESFPDGSVRYWHKLRADGPEMLWEYSGSSSKFYHYIPKDYKPSCTCANKGTTSEFAATEAKVETTSETTGWL
jgi:RHS repeat-associated protein